MVLLESYSQKEGCSRKGKNALGGVMVGHFLARLLYSNALATLSCADHVPLSQSDPLSREPQSGRVPVDISMFHGSHASHLAEPDQVNAVRSSIVPETIQDAIMREIHHISARHFRQLFTPLNHKIRRRGGRTGASQCSAIASTKLVSTEAQTWQQMSPLIHFNPLRPELDFSLFDLLYSPPFDQPIALHPSHPGLHFLVATNLHKLFVRIFRILEGEHPPAERRKEICAERDNGPEREDGNDLVLDFGGEGNETEERGEVELEGRLAAGEVKGHAGTHTEESRSSNEIV